MSTLSERWEDNIREWTGLEFGKSERAVENREKWRKLVAKSSVVPQRPSRFRAIFSYPPPPTFRLSHMSPYVLPQTTTDIQAPLYITRSIDAKYCARRCRDRWSDVLPFTELLIPRTGHPGHMPLLNLEEIF